MAESSATLSSTGKTSNIGASLIFSISFPKSIPSFEVPSTELPVSGILKRHETSQFLQRLAQGIPREATFNGEDQLLDAQLNRLGVPR